LAINTQRSECTTGIRLQKTTTSLMGRETRQKQKDEKSTAGRGENIKEKDEEEIPN